MARPRNAVPNLRWDKSKQQFVVYINRKRVYLGADRIEAERQRLSLVSGEPAPKVEPIKESQYVDAL